MILTGKEDLRVVKTIKGIKDAFEALICERDYDRITVKELCGRAQINKKTFYHYYETLDALLRELQTELSAGFLERIRGFRLPEELDRVNREFFLFSAEQGPAYEKITCSVAWRAARDHMVAEVSAAGWRASPGYQALSGFEKRLLTDFINGSALSAYREWVEGGKVIPLEQVIETVNRLQLGGVRGFFSADETV